MATINKNWSGADLYDDDNVSFPNGIPTVENNSIRFDESVYGQKLIEFDLVDLSRYKNAIVKITIGMTSPANGNTELHYDPWVLVSDGSIALQAQLENEGKSLINNKTDVSDTALQGDGIPDTNPPPGGAETITTGGTPILRGDSFVSTATFTLDAQSTNIEITHRGQTGNGNRAAPNGILDFSQTLKFILASDGDQKSDGTDGPDYIVNSLAIEITGDLQQETYGQFDGVNDYINCTVDTVTDLETDFTLHTWVKVRADAANESILKRGTDSGSSLEQQYQLLLTGTGCIRLTMSNTVSGGDTVNTNSGAIGIGEWHRVSARCTAAGAMSIWVDGVKQTDSNTHSTMWGKTATRVFIGTTHHYATLSAAIDLRDVRIYDTALSDSDMETMGLGLDITPIPVAWWRLDEGFGTTIYDRLGKSSGTLINANPNTFWQNVPTEDDLLLLTKLEEVSGTDVIDSSYYNRACTLYGTTLDLVTTNGKFGKAVSLTGNEGISCGDDLAFNFCEQDFTLAIWGNIATSESGQRHFMKRGTYGTDGWEVYYLGSNGRVYFRIRQVGGSNRVAYATVPSSAKDTLSHYALTRHGNTYVWYVNGVAITTSSDITDDIVSATSPLYIGRHPGGGTPPPGPTDDVRIYNRVLTDAEILTLATNPYFVPNGPRISLGMRISL